MYGLNPVFSYLIPTAIVVSCNKYNNSLIFNLSLQKASSYCKQEKKEEEPLCYEDLTNK